MNLEIKYPFIKYEKLFHKLGFKFISSKKSWIGYNLNLQEVESKLPEEVKPWFQEHRSFYEVLERLKKHRPLDINLQRKVDAGYELWENTSLEESMKNLMQAEDDNHRRLQTIGKIKLDFYSPLLDLGQGGYGISSIIGGGIKVRGTLSTYHPSGIASLLHELAHFVVMDGEKIQRRDFDFKWPKEIKNFNGTLNELKVVALTEVLCSFYKIDLPERSHFISAMADYPDSELFFNTHMYLVKIFEDYSLEDKQMDQKAFEFMVKNQELSPEEAKVQIKKAAQTLLHRRHKMQVLESFFDKKLAGKYTMEHVKFMFEQQLPFLKK